MKKKIMAIMMAAVTVGSSVAMLGVNNVYAANEVSVVYNGKKLEFDQEPIIEDGRTKVPFRKIFESMGTIVYYNGNKNTIMGLTKTGDIIIHQIGTNRASINGTEQTYDASSTVLNGRTLVPVRMISELQGAKVDWNEKTRTVDIQKTEEKVDSLRKEIMSHVFDVNFNPKDVNRYVDYKKKNSSLSIEQVIMDVNIDMDKELVLYTTNGDSGIDALLSGHKHYNSRIEDREEIENPNDILAVVNNFNTISNEYEPYDLKFISLPDDIKLGYYSQNQYLREEASNHFFQLKEKIMEETGLSKYDLDVGGYSSYKIASENIRSYRQNAQLGYSGENKLLDNSIEKFAYSYSSEPNMNETRTGLVIETQNNPKFLLRDFENQGYNIKYEYSDSTCNYKIINWLKNNSYKYGFIERYPLDKKNITKKEYMPWHYRYVGVDVATKIHDENLCLEEYVAKYYNPVINDYAYSVDYEGTQRVLATY